VIKLNPLECALNEADALRELVVTVRAENAALRKETDTLTRRIDELCREVESLRRIAKRIVKFNHDTDCATGHTECSACHGTVNPYARYCEHCGARLEDA